MKTRKLRMEVEGSVARSILESGSPPPLSQTSEHAATDQSVRGLAYPRTLRLWPICFCFLLSAFCFRAWGQYSIDWFTIDGGGGTSTGGVYSVSGTIGQPDASGAMAGGNYSLTGGFWSLYAVQTPGAPLLSIKLTTTNTAQVYWPSPSTGYNLQVNTNLATANWVAPAESVTDNGTIKYIIVDPPSDKRFYRLNK